MNSLHAIHLIGIDKAKLATAAKKAQLDATAGSCQAERRGPNRADLAGATSSTITTPDHYHSAARGAVHTAGQY
jgi:hypothetical protein